MKGPFMKSKMCFTVLLSVLLISTYINVTFGETDAPHVDLPPRGYASFGEEYIIPVTLKNDTGGDIWKCKVAIDTETPPEDLPYEIVKGEAETTDIPELKGKFEEGVEVTLDLIIKFKTAASAGDYTIPILVTGFKTACQREGEYCQPLRPKKDEMKVTLIIRKPILLIDLENEFSVREGDTLEIPFTVRNVGTATASKLSVTYHMDDALLGNIETPEMPKDANASEEIDTKLHLDTTGISYGVYPLTVQAAYFDLKDTRKTVEKETTIHILGPSEEEIYQKKLENAKTVENEARNLLTNDEFNKALKKYKEAKTLYEELEISTKVNEMDSNITLINQTLLKIEKDTAEADQLFQEGEQYMQNENYSAALEKINKAKIIYTRLFNLTKDNETYKTLYETHISECEEKIQLSEDKIEESTNPIEVPEPKVAFVAAIVLLLAALVFGVVLMRRE